MDQSFFAYRNNLCGLEALHIKLCQVQEMGDDLLTNRTM